MAATPAMLPLTPEAPLKAGEVVAAPEPPEPPLVLLARGVEVPAGVEPAAPEPEGVEPGVVAPVVAPVPVAEPVLVAEPVSVAEAELEPEPVPVAVVLEPEEVSVAELSEVAEVLEVVVSMGGTTMGWPADLHWATTAFETAGDS